MHLPGNTGVVPLLRIVLLLGANVWGTSAQITVSGRTSSDVQVIRLPVTDGTDLRFAHVSVGEGPSHSRVGQIVQDDLGFIWFGTHNGLQRYDGYRFREFRHDPANPNSLSGSNVYGLFKDREGKIWVGSDKYLDRYDPATEIFTHYRLDPQKFEGWVSQMSQDRDGILWLATNHGLNRLNPATRETTRYQHDPGDPSSLSSSLVRATLETRDGTFWVATTEGLDIFDRRTGKVAQHFPLPDRTAAERPHSEVSLCEDHLGTVWVTFSFGEGLARVDRNQKKLIFYSFGGPSSNRTPLPGARSIHEDADGNLWLGTASSGVLKLNRNRSNFFRYVHNPSDPASLSSDQVVSLYEDQESNIWVGTTGGGVNRYPSRPLPFHRYRHEPDNPNSLDSDYTSAVYLDSRDMLWVGSTKALTRIDRKTGQFTFYRTAGGPGTLSATWVISIAEDRSGNVWFGTIDGGLNRFDYRTGRFTTYRHKPTDPHSLSDDTVLALFVDHTGTLWAGTENGLNRFDATTEQFRQYKAKGDGRIRYRAIAQDRAGALWLGTLETGMRRLDPVSGQFTTYRQNGAIDGLSNDQVNIIYVDHSGTVWAGTENGLDRFDRSTGKFTIYYERDGLPSSSLNSILEDSEGNLWLGTSNGLSRFDPSAKTFKNYFASDGLLSNEFYNYASAYKSPQGEMFFNSYAGVISFFPDQIIDNPYIPPVVLTDFLLFGKSAPIGGKSPLKQSVPLTKSLVLSHEQNIFSFEFSALSYANPDRNRYRYRLDGLEEQWNETDSTRRSATYTTLAPGNYVFRVQARSNRGAWNENGASVRIHVLPPWWRTWWFRSISAVLFVSLLWTIYFFRVRAIKRRNRELERAEQEILALNKRLINAQDEERTRIARELHDDLSQQIAALSITMSNFKRRLRDPEILEQADRLQTRLKQMAESVRSLSHQLHPAILEHAGVAAALHSYCEEFSSLSRVLVSFHATDSFGDVSSAAALCIYRVTQEALQNVAKHSRARYATVELARLDGSISLTVSDRGAGISVDQSRATGGLGLISMKERVRLVNGTFEFTSEPNRGTTVRVDIPLSKSTVSESSSSERG